MRRLRVAIIDPSEIIAEGVASLITRSGEFDVAYVGVDVCGMIDRFAMVDPDVVILNSQLTYSLTQPLRTLYPELQEVALVALAVMVSDEETMRQFDGIINIFDNRLQLQRKLRKATEQSQINPYSDSHDLSERERDVLILVAKGKANKEIADELNISVHTVMSHRKNITHKTGIKSVAGLTVYALLNNLLDQVDVTL